MLKWLSKMSQGKWRRKKKVFNIDEKIEKEEKEKIEDPTIKAIGDQVKKYLDNIMLAYPDLVAKLSIDFVKKGEKVEAT